MADDIVAEHYGGTEEMKHDPKGGVVVIILLFFLILFLSYIGFKKRWLISRKHDKALQAIFRARSGDKFWDEAAIKQLAQETCADFLECLPSGDFTPLKTKSTEKWVDRWLNPDSKKIKVHPDHKSDSFKLQYNKIVFAHNDEVDERDVFKSYVEILYELQDAKEIPSEEKGEEESMENYSKSLKLFFVFYRRDNRWLLDEIQEEITRYDLEKL